MCPVNCTDFLLKVHVNMFWAQMESKRAQSKLYKDEQRRFTNQSTTVISLHSNCLKNYKKDILGTI